MQYYFSTGQCSGEPTFLVRKIQRCELAVTFFGGAVVSFSGVGFVFERAEIYSSAVNGDSNSPAVFAAHPGDAFIFGTGGTSEFASVPDVLSMGRGAKVGLSIVKAIMVDVVAVQAIREVKDEFVHTRIFPLLFFAVRQGPDGVKGVDTFADVPFELSQPVVIFGVNDGGKALRQGYSPEGVPIAQPTIKKDWRDTQPFKPSGYVKANFDGTPLPMDEGRMTRDERPILRPLQRTTEGRRAPGAPKGASINGVNLRVCVEIYGFLDLNFFDNLL